MIRQYSTVPGDDALRYFELVLFSFITGNNDMHLKNFSLFTEGTQRVVLTPAYDLLAVRLLLSAKEDPEELALTINGKKNRLGREDFLALAVNLKIEEKVAKAIITRQFKFQDRMTSIIERSFLSRDKQQELIELIATRIERIRSVR